MNYSEAYSPICYDVGDAAAAAAADDDDDDDDDKDEEAPYVLSQDAVEDEDSEHVSIHDIF
jgi:hypothetical protein